MKNHNTNLFTVLVSALILVGIGSCSSKKETIQPEIIDITESIYATGYIKSKNQYEVFSPINGVIEQIFVSEGSEVKKGDTIFIIKNKSQELAVENARITSVTSDLSSNKDKIKVAEEAVQIAQKNLSNDSLQFERQKKLWKENIGSKIELEEKEIRLNSSEAKLAQAKSNYEDLKRQLRLASEQSKNNLAIAKLQQDNFVVTSQVNGIIYKLNKKEGELHDGRSPVAIIGAKEFIIELSIDEKDIINLKKDQTVILRMDSYESEVFEGRIIAIEPIMNARTRSFEAEAVFINPPTQLYPNLTVEANIVIQTKEDALTIPRKYLVNDSTVLLANGEEQKIEVGIMDFEMVEILNGLDTTTRILLPSE